MDYLMHQLVARDAAQEQERERELQAGHRRTEAERRPRRTQPRGGAPYRTPGYVPAGARA